MQNVINGEFVKVGWVCKVCGKFSRVDIPEADASPEHVPHRGIDIGSCKGEMVSAYIHVLDVGKFDGAD